MLLFVLALQKRGAIYVSFVIAINYYICDITYASIVNSQYILGASILRSLLLF